MIHESSKLGVRNKENSLPVISPLAVECQNKAEKQVSAISQISFISVSHLGVAEWHVSSWETHHNIHAHVISALEFPLNLNG